MSVKDTQVDLVDVGFSNFKNAVEFQNAGGSTARGATLKGMGKGTGFKVTDSPDVDLSHTTAENFETGFDIARSAGANLHSAKAIASPGSTLSKREIKKLIKKHFRSREEQYIAFQAAEQAKRGNTLEDTVSTIERSVGYRGAQIATVAKTVFAMFGIT